MTGSRSLGLGLLLCGALALPGCLYAGHGHAGRERVVVVAGDPHGGPPDHAPAHGYRRKHGYHHSHRHKRPAPEPGIHVELVFDESLGVHVVVGHAGVYFHADHYYRLGDAGWQWTARLGDGWVAAPDHGVPTGLRKLRNAKGPKKAKPTHPRERRGGSEPAPAKAEPQAKVGSDAKAQPHAKAQAQPRARPAQKAHIPQQREDPSPEHRHRHVEHPGMGWN